jgi:hypothetical protein
MRVKIFLAITLGFCSFLLINVSVRAQNFSSDWSNPEQLFLVTDGLRSNYLSILTDRAEKVYTWWATFRAIPEDTSTNEPRSRTFHSQNILGDWRSPIDVMIWPDAGRMSSVLIDSIGTLHAFSATDCLSYTTAVHDQALSAHGWKKIGCLDEVGLAFPSAVQTPDGTLYVVYSALGNQSYRLIQSKDGGSTWSAYRTVQELQDNFLLDPMLAADQLGRLHLVWSVGQAPDAYPPTGVFYSRSDDGGNNWIPPIQLGGRDEGEPSIAVRHDEVHVLWNGDADKRGRYYRFSPDSGETWSPVEVLSPPGAEGGNGGLQRPPAIILDNSGNVHVLLHEQDALFYRTKTESGWTEKQALYNPEIMKVVEIFGVRLAITGGDTLHAMYIIETYNFSKDEDRKNHIWRVFHQSKQIDGISENPIPWLTPTTEAAISLTQEVETLAENATQIPNMVEYTNLNNDDQNSLDEYNPSSGFFIGSITAISFIGFVFVLLAISRARHNR